MLLNVLTIADETLSEKKIFGKYSARLGRIKKIIYIKYNFRRYEDDTSDALVDFSDSARRM